LLVVRLKSDDKYGCVLPRLMIVLLVVRLKSDDKYGCVLPRLVSLLNIVSETPSHVQAQESIAVLPSLHVFPSCVLTFFHITTSRLPVLTSQSHCKEYSIPGVSWCA